MTASTMTPADREFFNENGYLMVRSFFDPVELKPWVERFLAVVKGEVAPAEGMLVMRDVMIAKGAVKARKEEAIAKIQDFHNDDVLFRGYAMHPRLLDWIEEFVGPDITCVHSMLINKPPNVDGRHPLHQDLLYFPFRPADRIVATWAALERCTRENGCLVVVPGTHRGELIPHENMDWEHVNRGYFGAQTVGAETERMHLEMDPGDLVFFHPLLLHGSGRNRSSGFRRAISSHYAAADCRYLPGAEPVAELRPYTLVRGNKHTDGL